nr:MAG TPA: hypothetical protein [Caudoviricetes sp.]
MIKLIKYKAKYKNPLKGQINDLKEVADLCII